MKVLVTGGSRGIGAAAVRAFAAKGDEVTFFWHRHEREAVALLAELRRLYPGGRFTAVRADVADSASVNAAMAEVGAVEVLVCNAGIAQTKLFTETSNEEWRRMIGVHLDGAFYCCRAVLPGMIRRKFGRILLVSSMWGQVGGSCEVAYSAAKAGMIGLCRALAKEEGPSGITVNCVAPGVIDTDMMAGYSPADRAALADETPLGRLGTPEEVAAALVFLAGPDANFITGQVLGVNGGLVV